MKKNRQVGVLAKTKKQFDQYIKEEGKEDTDYIYAARLDKIRGILLDDYVVTGNFYHRQDAEEIEQEVKLRKQMKKQVDN